MLLTSTGTVKICDFGVSKLISDPKELMFQQCGTPAYIAPEVFANKGYCGFASDIWSAGVVLFTMLYGMVPFRAPNIKDLQQAVLKCNLDYKEDFGDPVSEDAISFLKSILVRDPKERLTPKQMFAHKWMKKNSAHKVNVFTRAEREKIRSEFEYFQVKKDPESTPLDDQLCGELLITTRNCDLKNASTLSIVLAPFNSERSAGESARSTHSLRKLLVGPEVLSFGFRVQEANRQYELNNNAQLDNGVYH